MTYENKVAWLRRYRQALRDETRLRDRRNQATLFS